MPNILRLLVVFVLVICVGLVAHKGFAMNDVQSINALELQKQLASTNPPFVIDVREPSEFAAGSIEGATLIPLGTLPDHLSEIPKDRRVVVYCRSGHRSARAAAFLLQNGYTQIENLTGGMMAWSEKCSADKTYCS